MKSSLARRSFGFLSLGEPVEAWTLTGQGGLELEVITYGGIVTRLLAPDRNGQPADVVLGFKDLDAYLMGHPYFGAITGRVAGRITGATFFLEGKTYQLVSNDPPNHLHGGVQGFDKRIWKAAPVDAPNGAVAVRLTYNSPNGEEGYPGTVNVAVTYTVTSDNRLLIDTEATTDMPTPFNLTHHSYFNLAGESAGSVADHEIQVYADYSLAVDVRMTLLGRIESVAGRDNDFRCLRMLGAAIPRLFKNHGDLYLISRQVSDESGNGLISAARLVHQKSGRVLEVSTTETHIQFYTGALLTGSHRGKSGASYSRFSGVCLECHGYPDGVNIPSLGDIILRPGHPKRQSTAYAFSTFDLDGRSSWGQL